ncbi:MAG: hypothetical protein PHE83_17615 [Opitutaceae bacterium]|nr:hypothetical protein [Opitutaceae bacterium]
MKYPLVEYARRGTQGSERRLIFFDSAKESLGQEVIGPTRAAGGSYHPGFATEIPADELERARRVLQDIIQLSLAIADGLTSAKHPAAEVKVGR